MCFVDGKLFSKLHVELRLIIDDEKAVGGRWSGRNERECGRPLDRPSDRWIAYFSTFFQLVSFRLNARESELRAVSGASERARGRVGGVRGKRAGSRRPLRLGRSAPKFRGKRGGRRRVDRQKRRRAGSGRSGGRAVGSAGRSGGFLPEIVFV